MIYFALVCESQDFAVQQPACITLLFAPLENKLSLAKPQTMRRIPATYLCEPGLLYSLFFAADSDFNLLEDGNEN